MIDLPFSEIWLPFTFMGLMGLSLLIYVILDGYDLGIGLLMSRASDEEKDKMVASIGPFWDANETWLVLAIGLLLTAFPKANGIILTELYVPTFLMIGGLILRGVSFDFRAKAKTGHKHFWNRTFFIGSLIATTTQGYMLGQYILGFPHDMKGFVFGCLIALCLCAGYALLGAGWLIIKMTHDLQKKAVRWAKYSLIGTLVGMGAVSVMTPFASPRIFEKWFSLPEMILLLPLPAMTAVLFGLVYWALNKLPHHSGKYEWLPFAGTVGLFLLGFQGLAYSFYPYIVPDQLTFVEGATSNESLFVMFIGAVIVVPCILAYTAYSYWVFRGKAEDLRYD